MHANFLALSGIAATMLLPALQRDNAQPISQSGYLGTAMRLLCTTTWWRGMYASCGP